MLKTTTTALLIPTLILAAAPTDDSVSLELGPQVGTALSHGIQVERSFEVSDLTVKMGGNEVPAQFLPELSFEYQVTTSLELTDEFLKAEDEEIEGPWRRRTLKGSSQTFSMEMNYAGEVTTMDAEASSDLDGNAFLVGRDEDGEVVARWSDEDGGDDGLLDSVRPEVDLIGLLPDEAVATGSTWEADASALGDVLGLDGQIPWTWSGVPEEQIPEPGETSYSGDLDLRVTDVWLEDGATHVRAAIQGELIETSSKPTDLEQVPVADGTATETTTLTFAVEGEFTWSVAERHLVSFHLEGEGDGTQVTEKDPGQPGQTYRSTRQVMATIEAHLE
ncbi:MAG: hypothetical protein AAGG01_12440 [Planctomycetota bacterium]